jgi:hypothetical protein
METQERIEWLQRLKANEDFQKLQAEIQERCEELDVLIKHVPTDEVRRKELVVEWNCYQTVLGRIDLEIDTCKQERKQLKEEGV